MALAARNAGRAAKGAPKDQARKSGPQFSKDEELHAYREMLLIRRFEEKAGQMYGMGLIGGFCHLYIGQEAVVVGMQMASKEGDQVITGYRDHGHMLVCGMDPKGVMAELTGRRGGYSKGKGGSMHMFSKEKHFYGGHGIVGAQVSLGTGLAFANWYREDGARLAHLFRRRRREPGPGLRELQHGRAVEAAGRLHRSRTTATPWAPRSHRASAQTDFSKRGVSFNIPGEQVDGMDVRAVRDAGSRAIEHARSGKGPYILEMQTYRYRGHSMSDPAKYRTKDEVTPHARGARPDRAGPPPPRRAVAGRRGRAQGDRRQGPRRSSTRRPSSRPHDPEPDASELWTDILLEARA